jgi:hypothetical protein
MVTVEKLVEWRLAGETEVLGENLSERFERAKTVHALDRAATVIGVVISSIGTNAWYS